MSDLRARTIRLAYADPALRPHLLGILAVDRVAMEFESQEALERYLKDHPGADKSKHTVKKKDDGGGKAKGHSHAPGASLGSKLKEHLQHILFDDVTEAWSESKGAYEDIVKSVGAKAKGNRRGILSDFKSANEATKTFFANRRYRRAKMNDLGKSIKGGAKSLGKRILHAVKAEAGEVLVGVRSLGQVLTPGSPPLDKKQKKALYGLGAYVAGAAITAAGGGAVMAGAAIAKSFSLHVGIKAISHLADSFFVHYEWGVEGSHIVHGVTGALSHVASEKDVEAEEALVEAMVLAVSKVLAEGMSDEDVERMLSGGDDDDYDDVKGIPAIDKLKAKADLKSAEVAVQQAQEDLDEAQQEAKSDKEAALRGRVIRLAHARPDLRPHLLAVISEK